MQRLTVTWTISLTLLFTEQSEEFGQIIFHINKPRSRDMPFPLSSVMLSLN